MARDITFDLIARDKASSTFTKVGHEAQGLHAKSAAMGAAFGVVAVKALEMGRDVLGAFGNVATQTLRLQRITGGSAEDVSRLRFALHESGIDADIAGKAFGIFSRNLVNSQGNAKKTATITRELGFSFKDAHGNLLPMADLLPKVADRFQSLPNGATKTALAMALFGRSGTALLPFLNKGAEGVRDLEHESDKLGNTLSGKDLAAVKANTIAKRQFHAALDGLSITVGRVLYPALTRLTTFMTNTLLPAVQGATKFWHDHEAILKPLVLIIGGAVTAFFAVHKAITLTRDAVAALNLVMDANPIGLVVVAVAALAVGLIYAYNHSKTFRNIVQGAFHGVAAAASAMWGVIRPVFRFIVDTWLTVAGAIVNGAATAFGWVPGLGPKLRSAARQFNHFRDTVNDALDGIHRNVTVNVKASYDFSDLLKNPVSGPGKQAGTSGPVGSLSDTLYGNIPRRGRAQGGWVTGGIAGVDSVPSMLMPGEFVVRRDRSNLGDITGPASGKVGLDAVTLAKLERILNAIRDAGLRLDLGGVDRLQGRAVMTAG